MSSPEGRDRAEAAILRAVEHSPTLRELHAGLLPERPFDEVDLSRALTDLVAGGRLVLDDDQRLSVAP